MVALVNSLAAELGRECLGTTKTWIADVAAAMDRSTADLAPWLLRASRDGDVRLSRCDLVEAHSAETVAASQITDGISEYHFIRVGR